MLREPTSIHLGMAELIRRFSPLHAASLYHWSRDMPALPIAISALLDGVPDLFSLRQHMYNSSEFVFSAVPGS